MVQGSTPIAFIVPDIENATIADEATSFLYGFNGLRAPNLHVSWAVTNSNEVSFLTYQEPREKLI